MNTLVDRLQAAGVRLTAQRRVVAEVLDGDNVHLTADEVLAEAVERLPEIGRATVYKALNEFVATGSIREIQFAEGPKLFDPNAHIAHHHLRCHGCDGLWDQPADAHWPEPPPLIGSAGFLIEDTDITFIGLCSNCHTDSA